MITIGCTSKLIKRIGLPFESLAPDPTTALGNWHANILFFYRRQILLFVSDHSRLAVITPAKEIQSIATHLSTHLSFLLTQLGVQPEWIDAEIREMADVRFAATSSRSVLGTMNDYKIQIEAMLFEAWDFSPLKMAINLSECPAGPLQYRTPAEVTLDLLQKRYAAD